MEQVSRGSPGGLSPACGMPTLLCSPPAAGKNLGRTKLTDISPKKTVEGAVGGLASSIGVAVALWKFTHWPATPLAAAGLGVRRRESFLPYI